MVNKLGYSQKPKFNTKEEHSKVLADINTGDILTIKSGTYCRSWDNGENLNYYTPRQIQIIIESITMEKGVGRKWDRYYIVAKNINTAFTIQFESCRSDFMKLRLPGTEATKVLYG